MPTSRSIACVLAALAAALPGCWSYRASADRRLAVAESSSAVEWPARDVTPLMPLLESTPERVFMTVLRDDIDRASLSPKVIERAGEPDYVVLHKGIYGSALLRIVHTWKEKDLPSTPTRRPVGPPGSLTFEPNAYMVTSRTLLHPDSVRAFEAQKIGAALDSMVMKATNSPVRLMTESLDLRIRSGLAARVPLEDCSSARGIVLHLQSLASNPFEPAVLKELERRGWVQIDLATQSSVATPVPLKDRAKIVALQAQSDSLLDRILSQARGADKLDEGDVINPENHPRFQDQRALRREIAKLEAGSFEACPGTDLDALGAQIAREVDDAIAGNAYGAESLLEYVRTQRPDLAGKPVVVMAFSAGALAAPAVITRLGDRVRAAVLIGGAADLFGVSQKSELFDGGIRLRCNDKKVDRATVAAVDASYLKHSALDPFTLAPRLAGMPVLQVHATLDTWVPAAGGELLYERLGRPDRMTVFGGHQILFYTLPWHSRRIADWVESHALGAGAAGESTSP